LTGNALGGEERSNSRHRETIPDNPYVHIASNAGPGITVHGCRGPGP
jgi:hypothetical protein